MIFYIRLSVVTLKQAIYNIYSLSMRKLRSTTLDLIALFNKKYTDSKRIEYIIKDQIHIIPELKPIEIKYNPHI